MSNHTLGNSPVAPPGCIMISSEPDEVFVDLDSPESVRFFVHMLAQLPAPIRQLRIWASRNGNTHAVVYLTVCHNLDFRAALAAVLGSDPLHVMLTLFDRHDVLYKPVDLEEEPF